MSETDPKLELDTSDVDRWVGVPLGGQQPRYPITANDIARWAQAMHNPNPLYFDVDYAAGSHWGGIVAPQSFTVAAGDGHGATPALQGHIAGTHMLFGGDEWWFHGPRIAPGDRCTTDRMLFDYKVTETRFAGPTMFARGDTNYVNQRGEFVAKQRSTSIRYRADEARRANAFAGEEREPEWSAAELDAVQKQRLEYQETYLARGHEPRRFDEVKQGDRLPRCPIGPHSIATFTSEYRSRPTGVWGATFTTAGRRSQNAGWIKEMDRDAEAARVDPSRADGLYAGPSRGHVNPDYARKIGMPRGYGYGPTMGGWMLDYLENWGGEWGLVRHCAMQYRSPAFTGDVTYLDGTVEGTRVDPETGWRLVAIRVEMTNQKDAQLARGQAELELRDAGADAGR